MNVLCDIIYVQKETFWNRYWYVLEKYLYGSPNRIKYTCIIGLHMKDPHEVKINVH